MWIAKCDTYDWVQDAGSDFASPVAEPVGCAVVSASHSVGLISLIRQWYLSKSTVSTKATTLFTAAGTIPSGACGFSYGYFWIVVSIGTS